MQTQKRCAIPAFQRWFKRLTDSPQRCPDPEPKNLTITLQDKREFTAVIKSRTLRWGEYPALSGGPQT